MPAQRKIPSLSVLVLVLLGVASPAPADVVTLTNGDRLTGTVTDKSESTVVLQSPVYGTLNLPADQVASVQESGTDPGDEAPQPKVPAAAPAEKTWFELWLGRFVPEELSGEIFAGLSYEKSSTTDTAVDLRLKTVYEKARHRASGEVYYDYERNKSAEGNVTNPTDQYGAGLAYEYLIGDPFFVRGDTAYLVNEVKGIESQSDTSVLLGWKILNDEKAGVSVAVGPGGRYQKLRGEDGEWQAQGVLQQDAYYILTNVVQAEQSLDLSVVAEDMDNYSYDFMLGLKFKLTPWVHSALRYTNEYDSVVSPGSVKREEKAVLELILPF